VESKETAGGVMALCVSTQFTAQLFGTSDLTTRAGLPATMVSAGTSRVTTLPAPIMAFSPMVMPQSSTALEPMDAPRLTRVGMQGSPPRSVIFPLAVARG